jgi:hypothetical protein
MVQVAEAVRVVLSSNLPPASQVNLGFNANLAKPALIVSFFCEKATPIPLLSSVAVESSLDSKSPAGEARTAAAEAERTGYNCVLRQHEAD